MILELLATTLILALFIGVMNKNLCVVSSQIDALQIDLSKIKSDIEEIKKAIGDNAFEAMLDKPLPSKFLYSGDLYKSHGGQIK